MSGYVAPDLTEADYEAILNSRPEPLKVPCKTGILRGGRFCISAKVGGEMQLVTVVCKCDPYRKTLGGGRSAMYVDVFGWGVSKSVNISKLREIPEVKRG